MNLRDALDVKAGSTPVNKIYKGTYKVWDRNKIALEGYCKQKATKGKQLLESIATTDISQGVEFIQNKNGTVTINGKNNGTGNSYFHLGNITLPAGTYYGIKKQEGVQLVVYVAGNYYDLSEVNLTLAEQKTTTDIYLQVKNNQKTYDNFIFYPMIANQNITIDDFEPYTGGQPSPNPDYPQEIEVMQGRQVVPVKGTDYTVDLKSKNLFDVNQEATTDNLSTEGVTLTINTDGTISTSGSNASPYKYIKYDIELPAGTYIFSGCPAGGSSNGYSSLVQLSSAISSQVLDKGNGNTFTLTKTTTIKYFPIRVGSDTVNFNGLVFKPMIRLATIEDDTYEPYYDYKLAGIGDYKDNFYTDKGKWYLEKKFENKIIDNNTTIYRTKTDTNTIHYNISNSQGGLSVDVINCISNKLKNYTANQLWSNDNEGIAQSTTQIVLRISKERATSVAELTEWLQSNNINGWFILGTPIVEEITAPTLINQLNTLYQAM